MNVYTIWPLYFFAFFSVIPLAAHVPFLLILSTNTNKIINFTKKWYLNLHHKAHGVRIARRLRGGALRVPAGANPRGWHDLVPRHEVGFHKAHPDSHRPPQSPLHHFSIGAAVAVDFFMWANFMHGTYVAKPQARVQEGGATNSKGKIAKQRKGQESKRPTPLTS